MSNRPAPKSVKKSRINTKRKDYTNSDSDSSDFDGATVDKSRPTTFSQFVTPDRDENDTDYGLELTTSNIRNVPSRQLSPLRSSTRIQGNRGNVAASAKVQNAGKENRTPSTSRKTRHRRPQQEKQVLEELPTASTDNRKTQPRVNKRKQLKPVQREKRFWKEVKMLQMRVDYLIPMLPFARLVREIMVNSSTSVNRISAAALGALQTSSEMYIGQRLQDAYLLTLHRQRVTLEVKDMELVKYFRVE